MKNQRVTTTFDKQFISGDKDLFATISVPNHGVAIHHEPENDFITYYVGDKPENTRGKRPFSADGTLVNPSRYSNGINPDSRYIDTERTKEYS